MVRNDKGQVAVYYYQPIDKFVQLTPKKAYKFIVNHNISLAWVDEEDVQVILSLVGGCCGNTRPGIFKLASEENVRIWYTGDR